jgi:hypothetical protein
MKNMRIKPASEDAEQPQPILKESLLKFVRMWWNPKYVPTIAFLWGILAIMNSIFVYSFLHFGSTTQLYSPNYILWGSWISYLAINIIIQKNNERYRQSLLYFKVAEQFLIAFRKEAWEACWNTVQPAADGSYTYSLPVETPFRDALTNRLYSGITFTLPKPFEAIFPKWDSVCLFPHTYSIMIQFILMEFIGDQIHSDETYAIVNIEPLFTFLSIDLPSSERIIQEWQIMDVKAEA